MSLWYQDVTRSGCWTAWNRMVNEEDGRRALWGTVPQPNFPTKAVAFCMQIIEYARTRRYALLYFERSSYLAMEAPTGAKRSLWPIRPPKRLCCPLLANSPIPCSFIYFFYHLESLVTWENAWEGGLPSCPLPLKAGLHASLCHGHRAM